jgi:hypothetical protein
MPSIMQRFRSGWNAFLGRDPTLQFNPGDMGYGYSYRPDRIRYTRGNYKSVVAAVYNRIAVDVAAIHFEHARLDKDGFYSESIDSGLNNCLNVEANVDQSGEAFIQDIVESMFDEGVVAIVPTDTTIDPMKSQSFDISEMRTGKILEWFPSAVKVHLYNEQIGQFQDLILPKSTVAIVENPFYSVMNEPNSTLQRLLRTISRLDALNDQTGSGKLDLIIQLPYVIKSEQRQREAERRRRDLEEQLSDSKYGVGYIDGTERVTQLNRAVENNLWEQVKDLTTQLFNQLGLTQGVIDGTADEATMINYYNNTVSPICSAITKEFIRKFLSKTARTQKQSVVFFRDPFKLVPVSQLADIGDKFKRNEIMTSNELRSKIGLKPSQATNAEELRNPNLNKSEAEMEADGSVPSAQNDTSAGVNSAIDKLNKESMPYA